MATINIVMQRTLNSVWAIALFLDAKPPIPWIFISSATWFGRFVQPGALAGCNGPSPAPLGAVLFPENFAPSPDGDDEDKYSGQMALLALESDAFLFSDAWVWFVKGVKDGVDVKLSLKGMIFDPAIDFPEKRLVNGKSIGNL